MEIQGESEQQSRTTGGVKGLKGDSRGEAEELDGLGRGGKLGGTILNEGNLELGRANGNKGDLRLGDTSADERAWKLDGTTGTYRQLEGTSRGGGSKTGTKVGTGSVSSRSISHSSHSNSTNIPTWTNVSTGSLTWTDSACSGFEASIGSGSVAELLLGGSGFGIGGGGLEMTRRDTQTGEMDWWVCSSTIPTVLEDL